MMRRWSDLAQETRDGAVLAAMGVGAIVSLLVITGGAVAALSEADARERDARWSQVEQRYDVVVLDRSVAAPRHASTSPVPVAMRVAGQMRQCNVQVVRDETMVFCGTDRVEAPRR